MKKNLSVDDIASIVALSLFFAIALPLIASGIWVSWRLAYAVIHNPITLK